MTRPDLPFWAYTLAVRAGGAPPVCRNTYLFLMWPGGGMAYCVETGEVSI